MILPGAGLRRAVYIILLLFIYYYCCRLAGAGREQVDFIAQTRIAGITGIIAPADRIRHTYRRLTRGYYYIIIIYYIIILFIIYYIAAYCRYYYCIAQRRQRRAILRIIIAIVNYTHCAGARKFGVYCIIINIAAILAAARLPGFARLSRAFRGWHFRVALQAPLSHNELVAGSLRT